MERSKLALQQNLKGRYILDNKTNNCNAENKWWSWEKKRKHAESTKSLMHLKGVELQFLRNHTY